MQSERMRPAGRKRFVAACADENLEVAAVELYIDDRISKSSTCIEIECRDRKVSRQRLPLLLSSRAAALPRSSC